MSHELPLQRPGCPAFTLERDGVGLLRVGQTDTLRLGMRWRGNAPIDCEAEENVTVLVENGGAPLLFRQSLLTATLKFDGVETKVSVDFTPMIEGGIKFWLDVSGQHYRWMLIEAYLEVAPRE